MFEAEIKALLAEHVTHSQWVDGAYYPCMAPGCDAYFEPESFEESGEMLETHHAEVIGKWLERRMQPVWGVQFDGDSYVYETAADRDWLIDEYITGIYGEGEKPPKLMRRFETEWEEERA